MDHTRALCHAADAARFPVQDERHRRLFGKRIGRHDRLGGGVPARFRETRRQRVSGCQNRLDGQRLPNHTGGGDDHVVLRDPRNPRGKAAHPPRLLLAVGVAGVRVAAVDHHGLRRTVRQMLLGDGNRRAFDLVLCINSGGGAGAFADDQRKVALALVLADAAVHPARAKALCSANAAAYLPKCLYHPFTRLLILNHARWRAAQTAGRYPPEGPAQCSCSAPPGLPRP